jgi:hypothetical protein
MLAKAACLAIATTTNVLTWLPPPSSKTVAAKKEQKLIETESSLVTTHANTFPLLMATFSVSSTLLHLFFMVKNNIATEKESSFFKNNPAVSQLSDLQPWHVILTVFCVLGYALRKWAYVTLGHFYTVSTIERTEKKISMSRLFFFLAFDH